jgi:hypothetical protein
MSNILQSVGHNNVFHPLVYIKFILQQPSSTTDTNCPCKFPFLSTFVNRCIWFCVSKVFSTNVLISFFYSYVISQRNGWIFVLGNVQNIITTVFFLEYNCLS